MNLMRPSRACSSAWSVAMKILQPGPAAHLSCSLVLTNSRIARPALARCCGGATSHISASGDDAKARIEQMVKSKDVFVFMKGVPEAPRCGFSNAVCQILRMHAVPFKAFDVLSDEHIRQGIKDYSNWPTIPQVFFRGEFVGGCDILMQMHQSGELIEELGKIGIKSTLAGEAS